MKKVKIMQVIHSMGVAGAEKIVYEIIKHLNKERFSFSVCCLDFSGELGKSLQEGGTEIFVLDRKPGIDFSIIKRLAGILKKNDIDIVHTHQYTPYFYGATAAILYGKCKIIFTEHGRPQPDYMRFKRVLYNQFLNLYTNRITGVSRFSKNSLIKYEQLPPDKIKIIHNGVIVGRNNIVGDVQGKRYELGINNSETAVAMIGRFYPIKNHKMLLKAFQGALKEVPDMKLVLVGEGPTKKECENLAYNLGIAGHVIFLGLRKDVSALLQIFDICVLSSDIEAAPLSVLEAMAAGLPAIATDAGGNPEIIINGLTGVLVPPNNDIEFSKAIISLAKDPEKRKKMGQAGKNRVEQFFNLENMLEEYERLYLNLI